MSLLELLILIRWLISFVLLLLTHPSIHRMLFHLQWLAAIQLSKQTTRKWGAETIPGGLLKWTISSIVTSLLLGTCSLGNTILLTEIYVWCEVLVVYMYLHTWICTPLIKYASSYIVYKFLWLSLIIVTSAHSTYKGVSRWRSEIMFTFTASFMWFSRWPIAYIKITGCYKSACFYYPISLYTH